MAREIGPVAPILAAPEEENLRASLSTLLVRGNHVRIYYPWHQEFLMPLDKRQGADAIPSQSRRFEIENLSSGLHLNGQPLLHIVASAGQEDACLVDQRRIVFRTDPAHARGAAPLDLMQQARARSSRENAVAAGS